METGMLWFDDSKKDLDEKVARAVAHYRAKYGVTPTVCFVNPAMLPGKAELAAGVQVRPARMVLVNHFWVGLGEGSGSPAEPKGSAKKVRLNA